MSLLSKTVGVALTVVIGAVFVAGVALSSFTMFECVNEPVDEVVSPDGSRKAVVFRSDCGATTDFSTQVSVLTAASDLGDSAGNVFAADTDHTAAPSAPGGGPAVEVRWEASQRLVVRHHPRARVFRAEPVVQSVAIRYEIASESPPR